MPSFHSIHKSLLFREHYHIETLHVHTHQITVNFIFHKAQETIDIIHHSQDTI